jgi:chemotaxis protein MotB
MRQTAVLITMVFTISLAAGCASTDWEAKYLEKQEEARALQGENDTLTQQLAEEEARKEQARRELRQTRSSVDLLAQKIQQVKSMPPPAAPPSPEPSANELAQLEAELVRLQQKYGELVQLTPEGNIEITLNSDVTFGSGKKSLTAAGKQILDSVAPELQGEFAGFPVRVIGHTDTDPIRKSPFDDNWELGAQRSLAVTRYLETRHGLDSSRLIAASRGQTTPVADNATKEGKSRNRRVEIVVVIPRAQILGDLSVKR